MATLSIETHLQCCVIVLHNGALLIQPLQPYSSFNSQTSHVSDNLQPFMRHAAAYLLLNASFCVIKIKIFSGRCQSLRSGTKWPTFTGGFVPRDFPKTAGMTGKLLPSVSIKPLQAGGGWVFA